MLRSVYYHVQYLIKLLRFFGWERHAAADFKRYFGGIIFERSALVRECDFHAPLVTFTPFTPQITSRFEFFQQRCYRAAVEYQTFADLADSEVILFPKHEKKNVLSVGKPQRLQKRRVCADCFSRRRIKRKAKLVLQL